MWRLIAIILLISWSAAAEPVTPDQITVIDGDTIEIGQTRIRMVGYDTPEIKTPRRAVGIKERALALRAKERFTQLLATGDLDYAEVKCACPNETLGTEKCNFGRKCAVIKLFGENVGNPLIAEQLAQPYICGANSCPALPNWPKIVGDK